MMRACTFLAIILLCMPCNAKSSVNWKFQNYCIYYCALFVKLLAWSDNGIN